MQVEELLKQAAKEMGIDLKESQCSNFMKYMALLLEWNEKINLTAITDQNEIVIKHFIDSLTCCKYIKNDYKVIDVGTGAGFPGIPIKILLGEQVEVLLMDSLAKRLKILDIIVEELGLKKIKTIHGRAEDIGINKQYRGRYDIAVSRAVANLAVLVEYCMPLIKTGGCMLAMKGGEPEQEVYGADKAIKTLGGEIEAIEKINLPMSDITHSIIAIRKIKDTPAVYPRKAGKVEREPIQ
ncbi:MAG: 16S rRNA (guanine(527)-N(7))-methyltransferase RsmG [Deltaproteobacteria bacterium]